MRTITRDLIADESGANCDAQKLKTQVCSADGGFTFNAALCASGHCDLLAANINSVTAGYSKIHHSPENKNP